MTCGRSSVRHLQFCAYGCERACVRAADPLHGVYADVQPRVKSADRSWQAMRWGEPSPGADVAAVSTVPAQMWQG